MSRRSQWTTDKKVPKKTLRKAGRRITFRGQAYLSMLRGRRMSRAAKTTSFVKSLKTNTSAKRTLSLLNQGLCWYRALPNMPNDRARTLLGAFESLMNQHEYFGAIFAAI